MTRTNEERLTLVKVLLTLPLTNEEMAAVCSTTPNVIVADKNTLRVLRQMPSQPEHSTDAFVILETYVKAVLHQIVGISSDDQDRIADVLENARALRLAGDPSMCRTFFGPGIASVAAPLRMEILRLRNQPRRPRLELVPDLPPEE